MKLFYSVFPSKSADLRSSMLVIQNLRWNCEGHISKAKIKLEAGFLIRQKWQNKTKPKPNFRVFKNNDLL